MEENIKDDTDRVRFIEHKGKSILVQDYSNLQPGRVFFDAVQKARGWIDGQPAKSVLTVVDASNSVFNAEVLSTLKNFVQANTPFIKCTAVVGVTGLKQVGLMAVAKVAGRPLHTFDALNEALDFLAEQE